MGKAKSFDLDAVFKFSQRVFKYAGVGGLTHATLNYASKKMLNSHDTFVQRFGQLGIGLGTAAAAHFFIPEKHRCYGNAIMAGAAPTIAIGFGKFVNAPKLQTIFALSGDEMDGARMDANQNGSMTLTFKDRAEAESFFAATKPALPQGQASAPIRAEVVPPEMSGYDDLDGDPDELAGFDDLDGDPDELAGFDDLDGDPDELAGFDDLDGDPDELAGEMSGYSAI